MRRYSMFFTAGVIEMKRTSDFVELVRELQQIRSEHNDGLNDSCQLHQHHGRAERAGKAAHVTNASHIDEDSDGSR